jgi:hypothetical protein
MDALGKPQDVAKLFVAAECWDDGEVTQGIALFLGYGAMYENGEDLSVHVSH